MDKAIQGYPLSSAGPQSEGSRQNEDKWNLNNFTYKLPDKEKLSFFVFHKEKIIGYMIASSYNNKTHLNRIAILDEYQGYGLGKKFMQLLEETTKQLRLKEVTLSTLNKGEEDKIVLFYEKLGYKILKTEKEIDIFLKAKNKIEDKKYFYPYEESKLIIMSKKI